MTDIVRIGPALIRLREQAACMPYEQREFSELLVQVLAELYGLVSTLQFCAEMLAEHEMEF